MTSVPVLVAGLGLLRQVAVSCRRLLIGSAPEWSYRDGQLMRDNAMRGDLALEPGKPSHLFARTGRLPKFAAGNGGAAIRPQYSPIRGDTPTSAHPGRSVIALSQHDRTR